MPVPIVSRTAWATRTVQRTPLPVRPATGVVVHHAVSALEGSTIDTDNDGLSDSFERLLREIEDFHIDTRGWRGGIAYSIVVGHRAGRKAEGRGWGLQSGATGDPDDRHTLSVCALGNYEGVHDATDELITNIAEVIAEGITRGELVPLDQLRIYPHQDKPFPTACCGRNLIARLPEVRPLVAVLLEEEPEMLTPEFLADGWKRYPDDAGAVAFVRASLQALGYKPGGDRLDQAIISFKRKSDRLTADEPDATVRGPFWRELVRQVAGIELPSPADPNPELVAKVARLESSVAQARGHIARAENVLAQ
jgi:hypothetical protein